MPEPVERAEDALPQPVKRPYDARRRRERAAAERRATRERVTEAAHRLFVTNGYVATKMVDIAGEAGVALASVYSAAASKAELLRLVIEAATAGPDAAVPPNKRPKFAAAGAPQYPDIAAESDPVRQVGMIADLVAAIVERVAPLWAVLREAAGIDAPAAETLDASLKRRYASFEVAVGLLPRDRLRRPVRECVDTLWALSSVEVYLLLRSVPGWSQTQYHDWLTRTLVIQLLTPPHRASRRRPAR